MPDFHIGQKVKAHCTFGREKSGDSEAMLRKGVITYIHPEDRHLEVNFGSYSECVFPNQVFPR